MQVKYKQDNLHCMTWYIGACSIMAIGLLYILVLWSNVSVLYKPWIQWLLVAGVALMGSHYRTNIISGVGHLRLDSVVLPVLCTIACNIREIGIVLQVP
jgi:hypothetical protein